MAAMLQSLGVGKGDRVLIYMPMIPEAAFAMLACARIGAIHSVVFGGFAARQPRHAHRRRDAEASWSPPMPASRGGKVVAVQAAARRGDPRSRAHKPAHGADGRPRPRRRWTRVAGRDHRLRRRCASSTCDAQVPCDWLESTEPSATSSTRRGTTGKPKGVQRDIGGYAVALAASR